MANTKELAWRRNQKAAGTMPKGFYFYGDKLRFVCPLCDRHSMFVIQECTTLVHWQYNIEKLKFGDTPHQVFEAETEFLICRQCHKKLPGSYVPIFDAILRVAELKPDWTEVKQLIEESNKPENKHENNHEEE